MAVESNTKMNMKYKKSFFFNFGGQSRARNLKNYIIEVKSIGVHNRFFTDGVGRQKLRKSKGWQECRAGNPLCTACINWYDHCGKHEEIYSKIKAVYSLYHNNSTVYSRTQKNSHTYE